MRILMLCQRLPYPLTKGEKIRAFHHLRFLARRHEVTLASLVDAPEDLQHIDQLKMLGAEIETMSLSPRTAKIRSLLALPLGRPMTLRYFSSPVLRERVWDLLARKAYDLIFVYSSAMMQYVEDIHDIPIVVDFVDMDSHKWEQYARHRVFPVSLLYAIEGKRMGTYERRVAEVADTNILVSSAEVALFQANAPAARVAVVPMVVDTEYFSPNGSSGSSGPPTVIFTGVMDYFPNVDAVRYFAREIYPRIQQKVPRARFHIVGQRPKGAVRRLARFPGVHVVGGVPDVRPFFTAAHVAVAPLRIAQGMQTKILEAMAMGLPVVATGRAFEGIDAQPGAEIFVEDDPAGFADRVSELLGNAELRVRAGAYARKFVESHHAWEPAMIRLDTVLHAAVGRRAKTRSGGP